MTEETERPEGTGGPPTTRAASRIRLAPLVAASALAGVLLLALAAIWLGCGHLSLRQSAPLEAEKIQVDAKAFRHYFTVTGKAAAPRGRTLLLTLKRTREFPLRNSDFETLAERTGKSLPALLALEAVARGYVRCEYFTSQNEFLGFTTERVRGLSERETMELPLPVADRRDLHRVVITY